MQSTVAIAAILASCAIASPISETSIVARDAPFTDPACKLSNPAGAVLGQPGTPLSSLFPTSVAIGGITGPLLKTLIGTENLEKIDKLADTACVNSQEEPVGERGICAAAFELAREMALTLVPALRGQQYKCLLNLLCVAKSGVPADGTCQALLRGADCVANRLIQAEDLECTNI